MITTPKLVKSVTRLFLWIAASERANAFVGASNASKIVNASISGNGLRMIPTITNGAIRVISKIGWLRIPAI